ncbi:nucleoside diphosphate kinase regulator [Vibrio vulnificus]|uniref:nucleoside diphosphate kinase regulator n=1 Tax=Vibrio vulnificus TaxID=672 RepID=UPI000DADEF1B|nr:nucleoside diphosphate kinase regulator [Vibrio vulnificus]ELK8507653.1 nucleoside diphosphate kinase regulator [Vibrio vulnificus]ELK8994225.1 nucleoside diphosphate kinase regulator [Vibrio vulnificus]ELK8997990.1 nucleoside diphosphate kinase regulator [Vibrio vulnificus]ELS3447515.1 nucleoside diphosphate kinase regulator [Vibrio vulnificus]ELS9097006.1 nucleoside diphosphate kinase regulator [Vibrio vulnificus]
MSNTESICVSTLDMDRISALLEKMANLSPELEKLENELDRANVLAPQQMPENIVTMNSTVRFTFVGSDKVMEKTLVYPDQVRNPGDVSIFAPVGSALLGLSVGQQLTWPMPGGAERTIEILEVTYQPERVGEFHL